MDRCARCGEELRPDANFCPQCGARVVREMVREMAPEHGWERCEIVARPRWIGLVLPKRHIEVAVEGVGAQGPYHTPVRDGCIRKEYGDLGDEGRDAVEAAVRMLLDNGWEMTREGQGGAWWNYRFRRPYRLAALAEHDMSAVAMR